MQDAFETYDAVDAGSGPRIVEQLRGMELRVSQKLAARLLLMGRRRLRLSYALLEEASPGSAFESFLLAQPWGSTWNEVQDALRSSPLPVHAVEGAAGILLGTADEVEAVLGDPEVLPPSIIEVGPTAGTASSSAQLESTPGGTLQVHQPAWPLPGGTGPLTAVDPLVVGILGGSPTLAAQPGRSERLQEAATALADSEDPVEQVEQLRFLFRTAVRSGLDPIPLLCNALLLGGSKRRPGGSDPLATEVARLVKANLDRELGRSLEELESGDAARMRDAIFYLLERQGDGRHGTATQLALPALVGHLADPRAIHHVVAALPRAHRLAVSQSDRMEPFLEGLLDAIERLEAPERYNVSQHMLAIQEVYPAVVQLLMRRLEATGDIQIQAFVGNTLSKCVLDEPTREACSRLLVEAFLHNSADTALQKRLKATFINLGSYPLMLLVEQRSRITVHDRTYLLELWAAYVQAGLDLPDEQRLAEVAVEEIGQRGSLLTLLRLRLLHRPCVAAYLERTRWTRSLTIGVLLDEALRLEPPDDAALFELLGSLGGDAVQAAFERARDEVVLASRSAAWRLRAFAHTARNAPAALLATVGGAASLDVLVETALGWPDTQQPTLPAVLDALGALGCIRGLAAQRLDEVLDRLLPTAVPQTTEPPPTSSLPPGRPLPPKRRSIAWRRCARSTWDPRPPPPTALGSSTSCWTASSGQIRHADCCPRAWDSWSGCSPTSICQQPSGTSPPAWRVPCCCTAAKQPWTTCWPRRSMRTRETGYAPSGPGTASNGSKGYASWASQPRIRLLPRGCIGSSPPA